MGDVAGGDAFRKRQFMHRLNRNTGKGQISDGEGFGSSNPAHVSPISARRQPFRHPGQPIFDVGWLVGETDPEIALHPKGFARREHYAGVFEQANAKVPRCHGQIEFHQRGRAGLGLDPCQLWLSLNPNLNKRKISPRDRPAAFQYSVAMLKRHGRKMVVDLAN